MIKITICLGSTCHIKGSRQVVERFQNLIEEKGLSQVSDSSAIAGIVTQALDNNPKQVAEYLAGNERVLQYFVGQVMKQLRGKAKPDTVNKVVAEELAKL